MGRLARLTGALLLLSCTSLARADLLPAEETECAGKQAGDACANGLCEPSTCHKLDYEHWDTEAGVPGSVAYDCVICVTGGGAADDAGASPNIDVPEPTPSDTSESQAKPEDANSKAESESKSGSSSGCSVTLIQTASSLGPWLLATGFALIVNRRRRQA